ncbi:MAG: GNAT family N-acetyltransferase [Roseburia sp.]|nr:GNAT family N-acetyltransferase [Roseburia sp.]
MIRQAEVKDLEHVLQITRDTILEIYSHYYAEGVVHFFLQHHSRENVLSDIGNGIVWLLEEEGKLVGTVTVKENAVNRLFVLPEHQSRGYGSQLMDFAENKIAENYSYVHIDSSLAAKEMYLKRGTGRRKLAEFWQTMANPYL